MTKIRMHSEDWCLLSVATRAHVMRVKLLVRCRIIVPDILKANVDRVVMACDLANGRGRLAWGLFC